MDSSKINYVKGDFTGAGINNLNIYNLSKKYNRECRFINVKDVVDFINSKNPKAKINTSAGLRNYCPTKNLKLKVDKEKVKSF